jgi:BASS family bile acid:Na+ symporter
MSIVQDKRTRKATAAIAAVALTVVLVMLCLGAGARSGVPLMVSFASLALFASGSRKLAGFAFTFWVLTFIVASMFYPAAFRTWGGYELKRAIVPLIMVIMFGMGTTLSLADFRRVLSMPRATVVGMLLQYTIMPLTGWTVAKAFGFDPEVAAGVILVGACPGGVASNVINYLAGSDVALSVTMTAVSTLLSPLLTPLGMKVLAGQYVPIDFWKMMLEILYMTIIPVVAGLIVNRLLRGRSAWLNRVLPVVSMASICFIIAVITALSRDKLLSVGMALIGAVMIHNLVGYLLGYWGARALGLSELAARTVSVEVGLQNAGMASGLAISVLQSSDAGLAPAVFGPWMNTSGSILASWWHNHPAGSARVKRPEHGDA